MKHLPFFLAALFSGLLLLAGCNTGRQLANASEPAKNNLPAVVKPGQVRLPDDCRFNDRATVETVRQLKATVQSSVNTWVLMGKGFRYLPCNLPQELARQGVQVVFSGEVKQINPAERLVGTPFKLSEVRLK